MTRVDAHHHLWGDDRSHYTWMTADLGVLDRAFGIDELRVLAARSHVDATIVVQTCSSLDETRGLLLLPAPVAGVIGWVDLTAPDVADTLDALLDHTSSGDGGARLVGIRHQVHDEPDAAWLERPDVRRGIVEAAARGLPYDLLVRTRELPSALRLARELPDVRFVLDHLAKPPLTVAPDGDEFLAWSAALAPLAACDNVVAKLSGLVFEAPWDTWTVATLHPARDVALDLFGAGRLLFGSDWPVCLVAAGHGAVVDSTLALIADLSPGEQSAILGGNAVTAYGLRT